MEFRGLMGGFYRISEWIMRFSVTNLLWLLGSLPAILVMIPIFSVKNEGQLYWTLIIFGLVAPFFLFPSTVAMFAVARKWVTGDEDVPMFKTYFRAFKENYLQSLAGGFFFIVFIGILFFNFRFYGEQAGFLGLLTYLFIALILVLIIAVFNFFCITVHLQMGVWQVIKNSLLITIGQPIRSFLIAVTNFVIFYVSFAYITFLIPFFMGSLIAYMTFWHFHNGFRKIVDRHEKAKEAAAAEQLEQDGGHDEESEKQS